MTSSSTAQQAGAQLTTGSAASADGTRIGYLRLGHGPAVILLHGSNESARSHLQLALAMAGKFTIYLPDRRGRGLSGPHRPDHGIRTEVEDLRAVLAESGAQRVFGVSAGGLIALEAARTDPTIRKLAVYEPALLMAEDAARYTGWVSRFDQEMAEGNVPAALITSMYGLDLAPPAFRLLPRRVLEFLTSMALKSEDKKAARDDITMRKLAPTLRYEGVLLGELAGAIDTFGTVSADVLLMAGSKGLPFLRPGLDALAQALPHNRRVRFPGLDHGGSSDISPANRHGQPEVVAPEVRAFFSEP
jgi:pimeloyl-ACP methyl ester carboxylesterase